MTYVLCLDFDETLLNGHGHNTLFDMGIKPGEATLDHTKALIKMYGLKNAKAICAAIHEALNTGNHVAILSFTSYPEIIAPTLLEMGLTEDDVSKIFIKGGFPSGGPRSRSGKNEHIQAAKDHFGISNNGNIILVDDSSSNIAAASQAGYKTIFVPPGPATYPVRYSSHMKKEIPTYIYFLLEEMATLSGVVKKPNLLKKSVRTDKHWAELTGSSTIFSSSSSSSSSSVPSAYPAPQGSFVPAFALFMSSECSDDDQCTPYGSSLSGSCGSDAGSPLRTSTELKASH